jgi:hypothetical protein
MHCFSGILASNHHALANMHSNPENFTDIGKSYKLTTCSFPLSIENIINTYDIDPFHLWAATSSMLAVRRYSRP